MHDILSIKTNADANSMNNPFHLEVIYTITFNFIRFSLKRCEVLCSSSCHNASFLKSYIIVESRKLKVERIKELCGTFGYDYKEISFPPSNLSDSFRGLVCIVPTLYRWCFGRNLCLLRICDVSTFDKSTLK